MPVGDMNKDAVRTAALEAFHRAEQRPEPEAKAAWAAVGAGYARIYAADVARDR